MSDKPVAELLVNDGEPWGCRYDDNITLAGVDGWIPLYTTPQTKQENCCPDCGCHFIGEFPFNYAPQTKPLSDEEIETIKQALLISMGCSLEVSPCAEESCKQEQVQWIEAAERTAKKALAILEAKVRGEK